MNSKKLKTIFLILGVLYVIIGALGISNIKFFSNNIEYIISAILLLNGLNHIIYSFSERKNPYFHWGLVLIEGIIEMASVFVILFNTFTSPLFFTTYVGVLLCIKGLILILGRDGNITQWEDTKVSRKTFIIVKGLIYFLFGALIVTLPLLADKAVYVVFGWYILFLGIHYVTLKNDD